MFIYALYAIEKDICTYFDSKVHIYTVHHGEYTTNHYFLYKASGFNLWN